MQRKGKVKGKNERAKSAFAAPRSQRRPPTPKLAVGAAVCEDAVVEASAEGEKTGMPE